CPPRRALTGEEPRRYRKEPAMAWVRTWRWHAHGRRGRRSRPCCTSTRWPCPWLPAPRTAAVRARSARSGLVTRPRSSDSLAPDRMPRPRERPRRSKTVSSSLFSYPDDHAPLVTKSATFGGDLAARHGHQEEGGGRDTCFHVSHNAGPGNWLSA